MAASQKGKKPGPGWRRSPKPIRNARAAAPAPQKIKKAAVHLSQRRMGKPSEIEFDNDGTTRSDRCSSSGAHPDDPAIKIDHSDENRNQGNLRCLKMLDPGLRRRGMKKKRIFRAFVEDPHPSPVPFSRYSLVSFFNPESSSPVLSGLFRPCGIQ